jgi:hypothetical protein
MSKKLAIKGHSTRGKEIIELLEMLGGRNEDNMFFGKDLSCIYFIDGYGFIRKVIIENNIHTMRHWQIFTLEEFLEKFPFKVGDKVVYTKFGDNCNDYPVTIESMKWTGTTIEYTFNDCVTCLTKDLKMGEEEPKAVISGICLNSCDYADEVELSLGDYEIEVRGDRTYAVKKKSKYPETFEECLNLLYGKSILKPIIGHKAELLLNLEKLLICRDAYWKIAGEHMGLDKPWEPQFENCSIPHYCIFINHRGEVCNDCFYGSRCLLAFPSAEMRDAFYKNFKDLIESCKELL